VYRFEIWDLEAGTRLATVDTEAEALTLVAEILEANTPDYAEMLAFGVESGDGQMVNLAQGVELAERARRFAPTSRAAG